MASSLETNKIMAAILTAGVIASGAGVISRILYSPTVPEEPAYQIAVAEEGEGGEAAPEAQPLGVLLASADASAGEGVARACAACHSFEEGGPNKVGPALHGVIGRDIAAHEGFAYSDALAGKEGAWDYEAMNAFLRDPQEWAPGTKMTYAGLGDDQDRADLIMYLRSVSPDAPPLPEPEQVAAAEGEGAGGEEAAGGEAGSPVLAMLGEVDPAAGETIASRVCVACHSFEEGGANKVGPNLHGVVGSDIASHEGFSYSSALQEKEGQWDYAALDQFLADPRGWAEGTKMAFAGIQKEEDRAAVIAYLRSISPEAPPLPEAGGGDDQAAAGGAGGAGGEGASDEPVSGGRLTEATTGAAPEVVEADAAPGDEAPPVEAEEEQPTSTPGDEDGEEDGQQEAAAAGGGDEPAAMVAAADPGAGETLAKRVCVVCHSFEEGAPNKIGPNLHGVFGRDIAALDGFSYSGALSGKDGAWDVAALDEFLADPRGWAQGTKMAFAGVKKEEDRAALIAYLHSISPEAPPLQ